MTDPATSAAKPRSRDARDGRRELLPFLVVAVVSILVSWFAFAMVTGVPVGLAASPTSPSGGGSSTPDYIYLSIKGGCAFCPGPFNASDQYSPANFTVPSHTLLIFTIMNYDNGQNPGGGGTPSPSPDVAGVLGNLEYQNASPPSSWGQAVSSVPVGDISHTFSSVPAGVPVAGFNVPIPAAEGPTGSSVTFEMYLNQTGTVAWYCDAPCDSWSMEQGGFMEGTITVV